MNEEVTEQPEATSELPPKEERDFVVAEDLETKVDRPEWLPEKYKTGEDLAKAYKELESKLGTREDDMRQKFIDELNEEAYKDRPETANDYKIPESIDEKAALDDEVFQWWAKHSYENGFSQQEFEDGINMVMKTINANMPDLDAEMEKLGDNAEARIEAVALFTKQFFPEEHMESIEILAETANGIKTLEFLIEKMKSPSVNNESDPVDQITEDSLKAMMSDERYWNPARRDMGYVRQVDEGFQKLHRG